MKKILPKLFAIAAITFSVQSIYGQNSVGIGTTNPNPNAVLELVSTDQGLLVPRLDTFQMQAMTLAGTDAGLIVYNTSIKKFNYWDGTIWTGFGGNDNDWQISGDTVYNKTDYIVVGALPSIALPYIRMLVVNNGLKTALAGSSTGNGSGATGVEGYATSATNVNIGVFGQADGNNGDTTVGVLGISENSGNIGVGVRGEGNGVNSNAVIFGVMGDAKGGPSDTIVGVSGAASGGAVNWAGSFRVGNVLINDTLVVGGSPGPGYVLADVDGSGKLVWQPAGGDTDWQQAAGVVYNTTDNVGIKESNPISDLQIGPYYHFDTLTFGGVSYGLMTNNLTFNGASFSYSQNGPGHLMYMGDARMGIELYGANLAGNSTGNTMAQFTLDSGEARIETRGTNGNGLVVRSNSNQALLIDNQYGTGSPSELMFRDQGTGWTVGLSAPNTLNNQYSLILPVDLPSASGQVLASDIAGNTYWSSAGAADTMSIIADLDRNTYVDVEKSTNNDSIVFGTMGTAYFSMAQGRLGVLNTGNSVFIGENAGLNDDLTMNWNTFIGKNAGINTTSGYNNTAIGPEALNGALTAVNVNNVAVGMRAARYMVGSNNTSIGTQSMLNVNNTGSGNVALGYASGNGVTSGSQNTFLGIGADASDGTLINATALGANAIVGSDSSLILGNAVNVGIGTSIPDAKLHVIGNIKMVDGGEATGMVLTSDANGVGYWQSPATGAYIIDSDGDTYVHVEKSADDDIIRFTMGNSSNTPTTYFQMDSGRFDVLNTGGSVFMGQNAGLNDDMVWNYNTFVGYVAGQNNTSGTSNVFLGPEAGVSNLTGNNNIYIGRNAGADNTTGSSNVMIGHQAGFFGVGTVGNVISGFYAGRNGASGNYNVMFGYQTGYNNTGSDNVLLGRYAGYNNQGLYNVFQGYRAGYSNTTGQANIFTGYFAGDQNTTGSYNLSFGYYAGYSNKTGVRNINIGQYTGQFADQGNDDIHMGYSAGRYDSASYNIMMGMYSGYDRADYGNSNVFIGYQSDANIPNITNATAIGANTIVSQSNSVILGNNANVGIGTGAPATKLNVNSGATQEVARFEGSNASWNGIYVNATNATGKPYYGYKNQGTIQGYTYIDQADNSWKLNVGGDKMSVKTNGDVQITTIAGELHRTSNGTDGTGTANLIPVAYGSISNTGVIYAGSTPNFTVTKMGVGHYKIDIVGESYFYQNFTTVCSAYNSGAPRIATYYDAGSSLYIKTWDLGGSPVDSFFNFVVYKN